MGGERWHEECGVFGISGHPEAANMAYLGLHALQHRGQEGSGIVSYDGRAFHVEKGMGLVHEVFTKDRLATLPGFAAIGHNRYATAGGTHLKNIQPFVVSYALGTLALAHNGNLTNAALLRDELEAYGAIFQSTSDSEVMIHLIAHAKERTLVGRIIEALHRVQGAYTVLFLSEHRLIGVRDPHGFRPLSLGRLKDTWVLASESCAFDLIEAEFVRDVEPGEVVVITPNGVESYHPFPKTPQALCVFEHVYFSRPDSVVFGEPVYAVRRELGRQLATESPAMADLVIPVPDSGDPAAMGYAEGSGIPYEHGLIRSHYVGRTFIEPQQSIRHFGVKIKLNAMREVLAGRRVVVVDDSIVRGTTSRKLVTMIRQAGAKEIHLRITSPPIVSPCYYGIDTPTKAELIASNHTVEEVRQYLAADSLAYLSQAGLLTAARQARGKQFCTACFDERYPVPITPEQYGSGEDQLDLI